MDRRLIKERMSRLRDELEQVRRHRKQYRSHRRGEGLPVVSLVGYTNAGKSTLLNSLTDAAVLTTGELFATLDPVTRRLALPGGKTVLITDTVGFIQNLPIQLVAAFRATLEEIAESDLILHVVDITHRNVRQQVTTVEQVLTEIGANGKPLLVALNKADLLSDPHRAQEIAGEYENSVAISALQRWGLEELRDSIARMLAQAMTSLRVHIPYTASELVALFHEFGVVVHEEHDGSGVAIEGKLPAELTARYRPFLAD
jgi:GTP-binding protein HflX